MSARISNPPQSVIPAKAGISCGKGATYYREIPAFAGMTKKEGVSA